ncbi:hypothetical protein LB465_17030 [Salegentibacter sp. LM13S]|uniref:hypothetical protein n=1 Tax=Salegentibacter lacus TaxID=2873599 RepID=UPI001CCE5D91|nr:hypothetical protein [Salegentibacter lacus]MBZ9632488.1 hypothetical protein [Salegentibacter lacus]
MNNTKLFTLTILIFICFSSFGQENKDSSSKWYSTAEFDVIPPYEVRYGYGIENRGNRVNLEENLSLGAQYTYNYLLFKKLSIGAVGGFQLRSRPNYFIPKLGGVIRYFFVDSNNVYIYLHDAVNFSLDKSRFEYGNNFRFGLGFPLLKRPGFNINANAFFEQNYLHLDGSDPILNDEDPGNLFYKSVGFSLGVKF